MSASILPFVDRDRDMAWLRQRWEFARDGHPQFAVLVGPPGIGKTRLVHELYRWLTLNHDPGAGEAYWPDSFQTDLTSNAVNPHFDAHDSRPRPPIPWLWWGLRMIEPPPNTPEPGPDESDSRDSLPLAGEAMRQLLIHFGPVLHRRAIGRVHGDWGWKLFLNAFNAVPVVGNVPGWLKDGFEFWKGRKEKADLEARESRGVGAADAAERNDVVQNALDVLATFLDVSIADAPTVPVVLVVDDAHWADRGTLRFLKALWERARTGTRDPKSGKVRPWPLLVLCTHWDDAWERNRTLTPPAGSPQRLTDFLHGCGVDDPADVRRIAPVAARPAADLIRSKLSGLPDSQVLFLVNKAHSGFVDQTGAPQSGINPRVLGLLLDELLREPDVYFEDADPARPLLEGAVRGLDGRLFDVRNIIERKFRGLARPVQFALGWSSAQGLRFLAEITQAIAERVAARQPGRLRLTAEEVAGAVRQGESPYRYIDRLGNPGRFNLCQFRERVFQEVARQWISRNPDDLAAVDAATEEVLREWLRAGRLDVRNLAASGTGQERAADDDTRLEREEARDALEMVRRRLDPQRKPMGTATASDWADWGRGLIELMRLDQAQGLWEHARQVAREFADARPEGWPLGECEVWEQIEVIDLLRTMRELKRAARLATALHAAQSAVARPPTSSAQDGAPEGPVEIRTLSAIEQRIGDIAQDYGQRSAARRWFDRLLETMRRLAALTPNDPQALCDLSVMLERVGVLVLAEGDRPQALALYRESLAVRRRIVSEFGETPQALRGVSLSLDRVGSVVCAEGDRPQALALYREGLDVARRIVAEFGETPEALRDVSVSLEKVGDVMLAEGKRPKALALYRKSLAMCRRIVSEFGETPEALRDVSISLDRVGDVMLAEGNRPKALALYRKSLAMCRRIVSEFGETPEALRDVSVSCERMGDIKRDEGNADAAQPWYEESLAIWGTLRARYGAIPDTLEGPTSSRCKLAQILLQRGDVAGLRHLHDARTDLQTVIDRGWATPETRRRLGMVEDLLARLDNAGGGEERQGGAED